MGGTISAAGKKVDLILGCSLNSVYPLLHTIRCAGGNAIQVERAFPGDATSDAQGRRAALRGHQKHRGGIRRGALKSTRARAVAVVCTTWPFLDTMVDDSP